MKWERKTRISFVMLLTFRTFDCVEGTFTQK